MSGKPVDLSKIVGKKPVALVFWTTWCSDCRWKLQEVNELVKKWKHKGLVFVGINAGMNDSEVKAREFMKKINMNYPTVFDRTGALSEKYRIKKVFCMIVAAKDGTVMMKFYDTVPEIDDNNFLVLKTYERPRMTRPQQGGKPKTGKHEK
jgi:thiol-disulfide isomerase/thioredoxin